MTLISTKVKLMGETLMSPVVRGSALGLVSLSLVSLYPVPGDDVPDVRVPCTLYPVLVYFDFLKVSALNHIISSPHITTDLWPLLPLASTQL